MVKEKTVNTWSEAKEFFRDLGGEWVFRGQSDNRWELQTSIERSAYRGIKNIGNSEEMMENLGFNAFKSGIHNYLSAAQIPQTTLEWYALMQHHGCFTRLLDFTWSPYVASFFALDGMRNESDAACSIWAINYRWCHDTGIEKLNKEHNGEDGFPLDISVDLSEEKYFFNFLTDPKLPQMIIPVEPERKNERLIMQKGLFLCPGDPCSSFEDQFIDMEKYYDNIWKITLPGSCFGDGIKDLDLMNINHATLFPGLDGFARSCRRCLL